MDTIAELLLARAGDARPGMLAGDDRWSYAEIVAASSVRATLARGRRAPGPFHVATLLDNVPEHVLWLGAAAMAGAVLVGGNPTHRGADLARDLAHTECQLLVTDRAHLLLVDGLDLGPALGTVTPGNPRVLVVDGATYGTVLAPHEGAGRPEPGADGGEDAL